MGEPGKAPACRLYVAFTAGILPSLGAPTLTWPAAPALVPGRRLEAGLDDPLGRGKPRLDVAQHVLELARDIGCRCRTLGGGGVHVSVEDGSARLHRLVDVDDPRQDLVVDTDQLQGLGR